MPKDYVINYFSCNEKATTECEQILLEDNVSPDKYVNAYCFLIYRSLDLTYHNISLLDASFERAQNKICSIEDPPTQSRWKNSLNTAFCYFCIKFKNLNQDVIRIAEQNLNIDNIKLWPRVILNSVMMGFLCTFYCIYYEHNKQKAIEYITNTFNVYQTAVSMYTLDNIFCSYDIGYELKEASAIIAAVIFLGKKVNYPIQYQNLADEDREIKNLFKQARLLLYDIYTTLMSKN